MTNVFIVLFLLVVLFLILITGYVQLNPWLDPLGKAYRLVRKGNYRLKEYKRVSSFFWEGDGVDYLE